MFRGEFLWVRAEKAEKQKLYLLHLIFCQASTLAELESPFQTGRGLTRNRSAALQEGKHRVWRTGCFLTRRGESEIHHIPRLQLHRTNIRCAKRPASIIASLLLHLCGHGNSTTMLLVWMVQQGFVYFCVPLQHTEPTFTYRHAVANVVRFKSLPGSVSPVIKCTF